MTDHKINRRKFLVAAVGSAGATAVGGLAAASAARADNHEQSWDREVDIVVIGYGGAGAAAAIAAHDAGARVLVFEKTASGGGSTRYSGGFFVSPRSVEGAVDYLMHCARAADGHHYQMDRESLVARTHALDRVLLWSHYVVPHYYIPVYRVAYWNKFGIPDVVPKYSVGTGGWWVDPQKEAALKGKQSN